MGSTAYFTGHPSLDSSTYGYGNAMIETSAYAYKDYNTTGYTWCNGTYLNGDGTCIFFVRNGFSWSAEIDGSFFRVCLIP